MSLLPSPIGKLGTLSQCSSVKQMNNCHSRVISVPFDNPMKVEKEIIKGKLFHALNSSIVMEKEKVELLKRNYSNESRQSIFKPSTPFPNIVTNVSPELLKSEKVSSRFEDLYLSPKELLKKRFNPEELKIILSNPGYFHVNRGKLKDPKLLTSSTLKDIINKEDEERRLKLKRRFQKRFQKKLKTPSILNGESIASTTLTPIKKERITRNFSDEKSLNQLSFKKSKQYHPTFLTAKKKKVLNVNNITAFSLSERKKLDTEEKLKSYTERKEQIEKEKKEKNLLRKILEEKKKKKKFFLDTKERRETTYVQSIVSELTKNYKEKKNEKLETEF